MPDFDVDFCQQRRQEVIDYAVQKYGAENVGQIVTYGAMKAKAVVRDVARGLGMTPQDGDRIAKLIPADLKMTLEKAYDQEQRIRALLQEDPRYQTLYEVAKKLEGLYRQAGIHASAVVISEEPLWHYMPTMRGANDELITQYAMKETEAVGLVKFDFLGLKTLTVLDHAERLVREHLNPELDLGGIPLDDRATYKLITSGNTLGIFQLESSGFQELLRKLRPDRFEDIVAAVALYRPGPLGSGMVDDFVKRKHGQAQVSYPHPWLEECLRETYGVIVYQEQVMRIAAVLAGFSLGQADVLRRAMGKKNPEEMKSMRALFLEGCAKKGVDAAKANEIFDLIDYFAGYGFNKSHSAAYALLTYQTAYLKAHYPAAFFAAMLTSDSQRTEKVVRYVFEARRMGIEVLPPDVNESERDFSLVARGIRFGLGAVRGVGDSAIEAIRAARAEGGPFASMADFCARVDLRRVNKRALEALIDCGAFDGMGIERDILRHNVGRATEAGARHQEDKRLGQFSLFDDAGAGGGGGSLSIVYAVPDERTGRREILRSEKDALGFYVSGHPLEGHEEEIAGLGARTTADVQDHGKDGEEVLLAGVCAELRERRTKRGERMGIIQLEDLHGRLTVTAFPKTYATAESLLKHDSPIVIRGRVRVDEGEGSRSVEVSADEVVALQAFRVEHARSVTLEIAASDAAGAGGAEALMARLEAVLRDHPGTVPVFLSLRVPEVGRVILDTPPEVHVSPTDDFLAELRSVLPTPPAVSSAAQPR